MADVYNFIGEITPMKENLTIKIRIIRLWKPPSFGSPKEAGSIEMVFLDEKGGKIQATVKKSLIWKFYNMLTEGELHVITKFNVGENTGNYRPTQNPYKINFAFITIVKVCEEELPIPVRGFNLISFNDILSKSLDDKFLIDVITQIVAAGCIKTNERNGKESKKLILELNDTEARKLNCTLWDRYAEVASSFLDEHEAGPRILIIQFAKIKEWKGEITLSNSLFSTRLFFNGDDDEFILFRNRLGENSGNAYFSRLSRPSTQSSISITEEFLQLHDQKTLDEILEADKEMYCITLATIVSVELENGWYYLACKKCNKKVKQDDGEIYDNNGEKKVTKFSCKKCDKELLAENIIPRFKVQVRVVDESGSASFVMFEREVMSILHKSASDLKDSLTKVKDVDTIPEELNILVGKRFLFKVAISDYNLKQNWPIYTILKMCDNVDLIQSYLSTSIVNQDSISCMGDNEQLSELSPTTSSMKRSVEVNSGELGDELSTTKKKIKVKIEKDES